MFRIIPWWQTFSEDTSFFVDPVAWPPVALPLRNNLEKLGHEITTLHSLEELEKTDYLITFHFPYLESSKGILTLAEKKNVLYLWETPIYTPEAFKKKAHRSFSKIFTWDDSLVDNKRYFKFFYPSLKTPMRKDLKPFKDRKFCTLVATYRTSERKKELHTMRNRLVSYFEKFFPDKFDLYGRFWPSGPNGYKTFKGQAGDKFELLNNYKFYICYENSVFDGYITEKIFDCFYSGCIPIYYGAPDISDYIPEGCYIDKRKFPSEESLVKFLNNMEEETYLEYLKNIKNYLNSEKSHLFSVNYFMHQLLSTLLPKYNKDLIFTKEEQTLNEKTDRLSKKLTAAKHGKK
ncbi:glycosyltransferase family 10 domain-containing protein [Criblamydia sequanensis]|nr:glycosyltransferase family 10 [Criblamydia sequanensis]